MLATAKAVAVSVGSSVAAAVLAFIAPAKSILITVAVLTTLDLITGVAASLQRKEPITSERLKTTVYKLVVYQAAILAGLCLEWLTPGVMFFAKLVASAIAITEGKSVLENASVVSGVHFTKTLAALTDSPRKQPAPKNEDSQDGK